MAAALGGMAWVLKAAAILVSGNQPPLLFEVAPLLFAAGLIGLRVLLGKKPGRLADAGGWVAAGALVLAAADLVAGPGSGSERDFSPLTFLAFACVLVALVLLGVPTLRRRLLPGPSTRLPLLLGVLTFPLIAVGGAAATINERLLEVPLLVVGAAWVWLATAMWQAPSRRSNGVPTSTQPSPASRGS